MNIPNLVFFSFMQTHRSMVSAWAPGSSLGDLGNKGSPHDQANSLHIAFAAMNSDVSDLSASMKQEPLKS